MLYRYGSRSSLAAPRLVCGVGIAFPLFSTYFQGTDRFATTLDRLLSRVAGCVICNSLYQGFLCRSRLHSDPR
jgi:hypothetical protein